MELGGYAIQAALERAELPAEQVNEVLFGHAIQAGQGQITARQAARFGGIPMSTPATTINKVCLSRMTSIAEATRHIRLGESDFVVAGGMESMTNTPHIVSGIRQGFGIGDRPLRDTVQHDGLWCSFDQCTMGESSDRKNHSLGIDRNKQDEWAAASHNRALAASESGAFADEITPVPVSDGKEGSFVSNRDEGIRPGTTVEKLSSLHPAFSSKGTITAGNASQISDGAAAVVVADRKAAEAAKLPILAEVISFGQTAGPDATLHERPAEALEIALKHASLKVADLDLVEINEAFISVAIWSSQILQLDHSIVNVNGGAVALGHPLGATGARIAVTLINALRNRGGGIGAAALCGGGGQGDALVLRVA